MKESLWILLLITVFCWTCQKNNEYSDEFRDISRSFSSIDFENTKTFILENGDRVDYCSKYLNNPHYSFSDFDAYLNPEIGQRNIYCDEKISDFNEIVIHDWKTEQKYYHIFIVRQGDIENKEIYVPEGMKVGKVYLLKRYEYDLDIALDKTLEYIAKIKNEINSH